MRARIPSDIHCEMLSLILSLNVFCHKTLPIDFSLPVLNVRCCVLTASASSTADIIENGLKIPCNIGQFPCSALIYID